LDHGSHSDIGGGYATGDLSDVALMWMIKQASGQGIKFESGLDQEQGWNVVRTRSCTTRAE